MSWDARDIGWEERVEFLNPGGSIDKGPEVGGGCGEKVHVSAEQMPEGRQGPGYAPFVGQVKGVRLSPAGKWNNGRIRTGRIDSVSPNSRYSTCYKMT